MAFEAISEQLGHSGNLAIDILARATSGRRNAGDRRIDPSKIFGAVFTLLDKSRTEQPPLSALKLSKATGLNSTHVITPVLSALTHHGLVGTDEHIRVKTYSETPHLRYIPTPRLPEAGESYNQLYSEVLGAVTESSIAAEGLADVALSRQADLYRVTHSIAADENDIDVIHTACEQEGIHMLTAEHRGLLSLAHALGDASAVETVIKQAVTIRAAA